MEKKLWGIKTDLKPLFHPYKVKFRTSQNPFVETLSIDLRLNEGFTKLEFLISRFKESESLTMEYIFTKNPNLKIPKVIKYSLSNLKPDSILPGIASESLASILPTQQFIKKDQKIVSSSPLEIQIEAYVNLIQLNLESIIASALEFSK